MAVLGIENLVVVRSDNSPLVTLNDRIDKLEALVKDWERLIKVGMAEHREPTSQGYRYIRKS